jgi:hypothetical protein
MGKGSNVQKAQAARERNQKKMGKTDEERKAASAKAAKDASAYICLLCKQTFMVNAKVSTQTIGYQLMSNACLLKFMEGWCTVCSSFDETFLISSPPPAT